MVDASDRGSFGFVLRRLRREAHISQEKLAERAHLSVASISAFERGRRRAPYRETIRLLSDALRLSQAQRRELESAAKRAGPGVMQAVLDDSGDGFPALPAHENPGGEPPHNLPLRQTNLVGRTNELADLVDLLTHHRLVTVTGAGGVGKTRIALVVGDALLATMPAGVWLVELAPVAQATLVPAAVGRALNVPAAAHQTSLDALVAHLKRKALLLILDNCEHVIGGVAEMTEALLQGCPQLRILTTSREPLRIASERTYRLPSLRVPTPRETRQLGAGAGTAFASVTLFVQRAQASDHRFTLNDDDAPAIGDICRRLDGIPLAIELAAARVNVVSVRTLAAMLDERFRILTGGIRTALPRHRTMRALIDWSYDLLSAPEQRLFERLSIFAGGCTLAAATRVYARDADGAEVLELLSSLVDKSLATADLDGREPRYRLLESAREYAREKLTMRGEADAVAHRHATSYAELAEALERDYDAAPDPAWFSRAQAERENLNDALHWTLAARGDILLGQRLAAALHPVWQTYSPIQARSWLAAATALIDDRTPATVAANVAFSAALMSFSGCEWEATVSEAKRLIIVFDETGDAPRAARSRYLAGASLVRLGRINEGEPLLRVAVDAARAIGNLMLVASAVTYLAYSRSSAGDLSGARAYLAEALELWDALGSARGATWAALVLAEAELMAGNAERAMRLGSITVATLRELGFAPLPVTPLNKLTAFLIACNRWDDAKIRAREVLELAQDAQDDVYVGWAIQHLVAVAALAGAGPTADGSRLNVAAQLLGYVDACRTLYCASRECTEQTEYDRLFPRLRDALGSEQLAALMTTGSTLTQAAAIGLAFSLHDG